MPRDRNGNLPRPGDEVTVAFRVEEVFADGDDRNVALKAVSPDGTYAPFIARNTRIVEKVGDETSEPRRLRRHRDVVEAALV